MFVSLDARSLKIVSPNEAFARELLPLRSFDASHRTCVRLQHRAGSNDARLFLK